MMWIEDKKKVALDDSDIESDASGDEIPIWVRGEQRWVSGVVSQTTCQDVITILLTNEEARGKRVSHHENYHITERWRGVEQPLNPQAAILDIWTAWGTAQPEVKILLRRIKDERVASRRRRCKSDSSTRSDRSAWKTIHPKCIQALQNEKQPSNTEELLKLVLAQGEVIRRQLKKLRHSEHQIGFLEEKTHRARIRKHGSNYLLETYLKGLSEAVDPETENPCADKNSDSGVVTEGDSEKSHPKKPSPTNENPLERLSPSSEELQKDIKDDDTSSTTSESTIREQVELFDMMVSVNKKLLKEEECLVRLHANIKKYDKEKNGREELSKALSNIRTEMAKSSCEMQHNEIVLEETMEMLDTRRSYLESLRRDLSNEDQEFEMLQTLLYSKVNSRTENHYYHPPPIPHQHYTKEMLDTLV